MLEHRDPQYAGGVEQHPELDRHFQTNIKGLHIVGAANGSPLLKTCINEGVQVVRAIARLMPPAGTDGDPADTVDELIIIGAGPAGLSAALEARRRGYRCRILEQNRPFNTIANFPDGKHVYAEPATMPTMGALGLEDATKEELLEQWGARIEDLEIHRGANVTDVRQQGELFEVVTAEGETLTGKRVIMAIGRLGNPRQLSVPGEDLPCVFSALHNPGKYRDRDLVVIGGGNSAAEAAVALSSANRVTLVHRGDGFHRVSRANLEQLTAAEQGGRLAIRLNTNVREFRSGEVDLETGGAVETLRRDAAFILIGADPPTRFLRRLGVLFEGQWGWQQLAQLGWVLALVYSLYAIKSGRWPYHEAYAWLEQVGAKPGLLYGILYSGLMSVFGLRALRKYRDDPYQTRRYGTLIATQWLLYFILPWALFYAGYSEWWRVWGVALTYPLGYYALFEPASTLFAGSSLPWAVASLVAFLVIMPIVSVYHGKRFCSWVCPCGGIADTAGDAWRQKAPRGGTVRKWESCSTLLLVVTLLASIYLIADFRFFLDPAALKRGYVLVVDFGLASIVAITLYPFTGTRIWCRFFCPLAKWMELWSRWTGGKLAIVSNDECISCGECTRYCQMGIDVRAFAQRELPLSNRTTTCVFCGICVTVCPVDVLSVQRIDRAAPVHAG